MMLENTNDETLIDEDTSELSRLTVIVPVYNEEDSLPDFQTRLSAMLRIVPVEAEILYIDDGSNDATLRLLRCFQQSSHIPVSILQLSRNFGKEVAISAGLDHANADAIIIIDADLQDPPELIPDMLLEWRRGNDMVCMRRLGRDNEGFVKRITARLFYRLMSFLSSVKIEADVGDFRLLSNRVVTALRQLPERDRLMKGLFAWVGFKTITLDYNRFSRQHGKTKFKLTQLSSLALDGITSFSILPLRLASYTGLLVSLLAFLFGFFIVIKSVLYGETVAGYPTLMATLTFLGGMQLLAIGLLGEYLGRMYIETKDRPLYIIDTYKPGRKVPESPVVNNDEVDFLTTVRS